MLRAGELDRSDFDDAWAAWIDPIAEENVKAHQPRPTPSVSDPEKTFLHPSQAPSRITPAQSTPELASPAQSTPYEPFLRSLLALATTLAFTAWLNNHDEPSSHGLWPLLISLPFGILGLSGAILASSPRPFFLFGITSIAQTYLLAQNLSSLLALPFSQIWLMSLILLTTFGLSMRCVDMLRFHARPSTAYQWRSSEWALLVLILGLAMQAALTPIPNTFSYRNTLLHANVLDITVQWLPLALILFADSTLTFGRPPRPNFLLHRWTLRFACQAAAWWWAIASSASSLPTNSDHLIWICIAIVSTIPMMAMTWMDSILRQPLTRPNGMAQEAYNAPQPNPTPNLKIHANG